MYQLDQWGGWDLHMMPTVVAIKAEVIAGPIFYILRPYYSIMQTGPVGCYKAHSMSPTIRAEYSFVHITMLLSTALFDLPNFHVD